MKKGWSPGLSFVLIGVTYFAVAFIGLRLAFDQPERNANLAHYRCCYCCHAMARL